MRSLPTAPSWSLPLLLALVFLACGDRRSEFTGPRPVLPPAALLVQVRDAATGVPVQGAQVFLQPLDAQPTDTRPVMGAISDASGAAPIGAIPPGRYRLVARRIGYQETRRPLDLRHGAPVATDLRVALEVAPGCNLGSRIVAR